MGDILVVASSIAILDVGHGNCTVVTEDARAAVIDAGPGSALLEFLTEQKVTRVELAILSHADGDHVAGLLAVLASGLFEVQAVRANADGEKDTALWDDLLWQLEKLKEAGEVDFKIGLCSGDTFNTPAATTAQVVAPSAYLAGLGAGNTDREGRRVTSNSISAVVRLDVSGQPAVLLAGDMDRIGLDHLAASGVSVRAPILVFPHHGGRPGLVDEEAFARDLCSLAQPDEVVFSIGRGRYDTPRPALVAAILRARPGVRIACTQLSRHCSNLASAASTSHLNAVFARGRAQNFCCAGTLVIDTARRSLLPSRDAHGAFIAMAVPKPLCRPS